MYGGQEQSKESKKIGSATYGRVFSTFKPYKLQVTWILVLVVISVGFGLIPPFLLKDIIDEGLPHANLGLIAKLSVETIIFTVAASSLTYWYGYESVSIGQLIMRDLRRDLFNHLQGMSLRFFSNTRTGEIQSRLLNDVAGVQSVVSDVITNAVSNFGVIIASLIAMFVLDWRLTLLSIGIIPCFAVVASLAGNYARKVRRSLQEQVAELNSVMQESLSVSGILLTKAVGRRTLITEKFGAENEKIVIWQVRQQMIQYFFFGIFRMIFSVTPALVYWFAGWIISRQPGAITIGTIVAFTGLQARMFFPLTGILGIQIELKSSMGLFDRIFDYLDRPQDITDSDSSVALSPAEINGHVEFKDVEFSYEPSNSEPTIKSINFGAKPGELIALVGPSGAGKTTIAYLIARLYDADSGEVSIDGHNVKDIKLDSLERIVGAVTQETYLAHSTIRENLRFANPDATSEMIEDAAKAAAIYDYIASLPDGFDTVVGERGYKLSGGEKQRIALARTILKNPRILILDEATSALDSASEKTIQASLDRLMEGRTTFAIAHRLSTIINADQILVIDGGRIMESGKHKQLLSKNGLYAKLYHEQFGHGAASVTMEASQVPV